LWGVPVAVIFPYLDGVLAVRHIRVAADIKVDRRPRPTLSRRGQGLGFLLGLPDGNVSSIALHVQRRIVVEESPLVLVNGLPLVGNCPGQITETDLAVGLAMPPGFRRVCDNALNGSNRFFGGPLLRKSLNDAGSCMFEENVVGTEGPLGFVLGFFPRSTFRRRLALGCALGRTLGARTPGGSPGTNGFVGISTREGSSGFRCHAPRFLRVVAFLLEFDVATTVVKARPFLGAVGNVSFLLEQVHVNVDGLRLDGLVDCGGGMIATVRHFWFHHLFTTMLPMDVVCYRLNRLFEDSNDAFRSCVPSNGCLMCFRRWNGCLWLSESYSKAMVLQMIVIVVAMKYQLYKSVVMWWCGYSPAPLKNIRTPVFLYDEAI